MLPFARQFFFVMRVRVNTTLREHNVFTDFGYLSIYLDLFLQLYNIQKLGVQRDRYGSVSGHS